MSKISFENKKGKITIINKLAYPESINERVYNAIVSGVFEGFLPVAIRQKRKETRVECVVQGLIPLKDYFSGIVTKKMFLDTVYQIIQLLKNCEKNMVNCNNLDLQSDLLFLDPQTKNVYCVFWPIVNNQRETPPQLFLKKITSEFTFNPHEDNEYLQQYNAFFSGVDPFSVKNFERLILKLQGKKSIGGHTPSVDLKRDQEERRTTEEKKKINIEYDPFAEQADVAHVEKKEVRSGLVCPSCKTENPIDAVYCMKCTVSLKANINEKKEKKVPDTIDFGTMVLGDDSGGTTVLGYDEPEIPMFPTLTRVKTEESFVIDKSSFRIGAEEETCDLFIGDNTYISRKHVDIITKDERYYIVDLRSTNKTFVDGKVVPINTEVEIFSGTEIRLANEDFVFSIES